MIRLAVILLSVGALCSCGTAPKTYLSPDSSKIRAAAGKLSVEVDAAHASARKAQTAVSVAQKRQKEIDVEVKKLKDVPKALVQKIDDQDSTLDDASNNQSDLETHLTEADKAKATVTALSHAYFGQVDKLAADATSERNARIKDENSLHWYRMHWWGSWIALGLGVLACIVFAAVKFGLKFGL